MLTYYDGNILDDNAEALINPVNCVGVSGKGLALSFRQKFPDNFKAYKAMCSRGALAPGKLFLFRSRGKLIVNFPTKVHWRHQSYIEHIAQGLETLNNTIKERNIQTVAMPALGCGLGGLDWDLFLTTVHVFMEYEKFDLRLYLPLESGAKWLVKK